MTRDLPTANVCIMYLHSIFDAGWTTGGREIGSTNRLDLLSDCRRACEEPNEDVRCQTMKCKESTNRRYTIDTAF
jgi:hypothetical protein